MKTKRTKTPHSLMDHHLTISESLIKDLRKLERRKQSGPYLLRLNWEEPREPSILAMEGPFLTGEILTQLMWEFERKPDRYRFAETARWNGEAVVIDFGT